MNEYEEELVFERKMGSSLFQVGNPKSSFPAIR